MKFCVKTICVSWQVKEDYQDFLAEQPPFIKSKYRFCQNGSQKLVLFQIELVTPQLLVVLTIWLKCKLFEMQYLFTGRYKLEDLKCTQTYRCRPKCNMTFENIQVHGSVE